MNLPVVFVFCTFWWFVVFAIGSIMLAWSLTWESHPYRWATVFLIVPVILWFIFGDATNYFHEWQWKNLLVISEWVAGWFVIGSAYMLFRWWEKNRERLEDYETNWRDPWLREHGFPAGEVPEAAKEAFKKDTIAKGVYVKEIKRIINGVEVPPLDSGSYWQDKRKRETEYETVISLTLDHSQYKSDLAAWMVFWLWSMAQWIVSELFFIVANRIIRMLGKLMDWISSMTFKRALQDFEKKA